MRRSAKLVIASAIACSAAACILSIDPLPSASLASEAGVGPDGSTTGPSADGGAEGSAPDGGVEGGRFCDTIVPAPAFCDDFDEDQSAIGWTQRNVDDGGVLELDDAAAVSNPTSLRTRMKTTTSCTYSEYWKALNKTYTTRVKLAFDARPGHVGAAGGFNDSVAVNELNLGAPGGAGACGFYLNVNASSGQLSVERAGNAQLPLSKNFVDGVWTHVEITVDTTGHVEVKFDGQIVASGTAPAACKYGNVEGVDVGFLCVSPSADNEFHLDNIVLTTE